MNIRAVSSSGSVHTLRIESLLETVVLGVFLAGALPVRGAHPFCKGSNGFLCCVVARRAASVVVARDGVLGLSRRTSLFEERIPFCKGSNGFLLLRSDASARGVEVVARDGGALGAFAAHFLFEERVPSASACRRFPLAASA